MVIIKIMHRVIIEIMHRVIIEIVPRVRFELFPGKAAEVEPIIFDGENLTLAENTKFDRFKPMKVIQSMCEDKSSNIFLLLWKQ